MQPLNAVGIPRLFRRGRMSITRMPTDVFNNTNYSDYNVDYFSNGNLPANPVTFNQVGNILGTPRTLKVQAGVKF
jgi:hypothetical protein